MTEIGKYVQKIGQGSRGTPGTPTVSSIENQGFGTPLLTKALMKNAEIGQRRWASIGVDEWIQAGRWWLLKVFTLLNHISCLTLYQSQSVSYMRDSPEKMLSKQGYADLVKASWILVDLIAQHPQLNLLGSDVRCDAEVLAEVRHYHECNHFDHFLINMLFQGNQK